MANLKVLAIDDIRLLMSLQQLQMSKSSFLSHSAPHTEHFSSISN